MKLFLMLLFLPVFAFAQQKKDSRIVVHITDTSRLFDKVINQLYTEDYIVKVDDKAHGLIVTEQRALKNDESILVIYKLRLTDTAITFTGEGALNATIKLFGVETGPTFSSLYYGGSKSSGLRKAWNEMDRLAKTFGSVRYMK